MKNGSIDAQCAGAKTYCLKKKKIQQKLNLKLKEGYYLGLDTALKTGWCKIRIVNDNIFIEGGSVDVNKIKGINRLFTLIDVFRKLITGKEDAIIIEDTFNRLNPVAFKLISRIGMIVFVIGYIKGIRNMQWKYANSARKELGFKGNLKKEEFQIQFLNKLGIEEKDNDYVDAIALAMSGAKYEKYGFKW